MPMETGQTRPTRFQATITAYPPPNMAEPLPCPRCNSMNTKFCYYNNYNLAQPRYFCKSCHHYWTRGGTLHDIPVSGGTRRSSSKRHRSFSTTASSAKQGTVITEEESKTKGSDVSSGYGSFGSLLNEGAFLALGSGSGGSDYGFGYGFEDMSIGYSEYLGATGGEIPVSDSGSGDTWQIREIKGKSGDSLIWPGLK